MKFVGECKSANFDFIQAAFTCKLFQWGRRSFGQTFKRVLVSCAEHINLVVANSRNKFIINTWSCVLVSLPSAKVVMTALVLAAGAVNCCRHGWLQYDLRETNPGQDSEEADTNRKFSSTRQPGKLLVVQNANKHLQDLTTMH